MDILEQFFPAFNDFTPEIKSTVKNFFIANRDNVLSLTVKVPNDILIEMLKIKGIEATDKFKILLDKSTSGYWWIDIESINAEFIRIYTSINRKINTDLHIFLELPEQEISEFTANKVGLYYDMHNDTISVKKEYFLIKTDDGGRIYHQFKYSADNTFIAHTEEIFVSDESAFNGPSELVEALKTAGFNVESSYRSDCNQTYLIISRRKDLSSKNLG